jgi:putative transposase
MRVHRSGFYAWLKEPLSARAQEDRRLLPLIRSSYAGSDMVYDSPRIHMDLREMGEVCGERKVARLMKQNGIRTLLGYKSLVSVAASPLVSHRTGWDKTSTLMNRTRSG